MNIKSLIGEHPVNGDLAAYQYLTNLLGRSMVIDNWILFFLFDFKELAEKYLFAAQKEVLEKLKNLIKHIESDFLEILKNGTDSSIEILFYSMLIPLDAIINKALKTWLGKIAAKYNQKLESGEFLKHKDHLKK